MFLRAPSSSIPQDGRIPLILPSPTQPLLVVLSPCGLVSQDQVRVLHGDEDGLVVLGIWTYRGVDQNDPWNSKDICEYLCYVFFVDFNPWRCLATCPNPAILRKLLRFSELHNHPPHFPALRGFSNMKILRPKSPTQAKHDSPAAAVGSCPWSCQDDTPATAACRRDSLHPAGAYSSMPKT